MPPRRKFNAHFKRLVAARAEWRCAACGDLLDETYDIDHRVPLHRGGADDITNMEPLHSSCHRKKTLSEEIERLAAREAARGQRGRGVLECAKCGSLVSPYFLHRC